MLRKDYKMKKLQDLLLKIPRGKVTSYGVLAKKLKVHPRVVGRMLSKNFSDKYPCYKVICSNGKIGGFSGSGGIKEKIKRLKRDGIEVKNNKIDLKKFLYIFTTDR